MWHTLEQIPGLSAVPSVWRRRLADRFEPFQRLCLQPGVNPVRSYPCPLQTSCAYRIVENCTDPEDQSALSFVGDVVSSSSSFSSSSSICGPPTHSPTFSPTHFPAFSALCPRHHCEHLALTQTDITPLQLSWPRLTRALVKAFDLDARSADFGIPHTVQFATWSADAVPVILTIQTERREFRHVAAELVARLNAPFILFSPTNRLVDIHSQELLNRVKACVFPLESTVTLSDHGTLHPKTAPGELFAAFTPQPKELERSVAERAMAVVQQFDHRTCKVFRMYCIDELSALQIARKLNCSKAAVVRSLVKIRRQTGTDPKDLRRLSSHLDKAPGFSS